MPPVLLIDDDPDIRVLVEMALRLHDIDTIACSQGMEGLKALETSIFSLVILDVMMPDMSGYEVLHTIATRFGTQAPPVAVFSARPPDALARELHGLPVACILPKPFEPDKLATIVEALIRK
ncbi:MAG TPA: response regulator [bacterium]|jgi:DNA-binding response OmpR family regulator